MADYFNRMSVATIKQPEFLNISSVSPLVSKCEIKVLYIGENRNRSMITKEVATQMAATLPCTPIVGQYIDKKEDFGDHGDQMIIDGEGVRFNKLTKPYGFVAPDAKIWFQEFEDTDEFGNVEIREYLMTEGYLWTEQYEECKRVIDQGNPQSMELDENSLKGHWSNDTNRGIEFFIINDAIFSKLCILGEDVEPCFEGANVTAPALSGSFSLDDNFKITLFSMMNELKDILNNKGGYSMPGQNQENFSNVQDETVEFTPSENQNIIGDVKTTFDDGAAGGDAGSEGDSSDVSVDADAPVVDGGEEATVDLVAESLTDDEDPDPTPEDTACMNVPNGGKQNFAKEEEKTDDAATEEEDEKKKEDVAKNTCNDDEKKKFELVKEELETLKAEYALLKEERDSLAEYKNAVENEKKDEMIDSFYMLSDEDKADVIANKVNYSVEQIKEKLSVICFDKKVNFNDNNNNSTDEAPVTYNLNATEADTLPTWLKAVEAVREHNN